MTKGKVFLVGAGPGDPGLLTLRGAELLRAADMVAYDALVSPQILTMANPTAALVEVGHRCGKDAPYRLHPSVIEHARRDQKVVRLKGGDPLIFGRLAGELEELDRAGIPWEIVPGITAGQAAAALLGVPLTDRDHASDVAFATGHDAGGAHESLSRWEHLARAGGTLVLYMATARLEENLKRLLANGRAPVTPAVYVADASRPEMTVVLGTLGDLASRVPKTDRPGVVLVGGVLHRLRGTGILTSFGRGDRCDEETS